METFFSFENIQEIKFTKVEGNIFSISIQSDIQQQDIIYDNTLFTSQLCKIDSTLELRLDREYTDINLGREITTAETYSIPMKVVLLFNQDGTIFTVEKNHGR